MESTKEEGVAAGPEATKVSVKEGGGSAEDGIALQRVALHCNSQSRNPKLGNVLEPFRHVLRKVSRLCQLCSATFEELLAFGATFCGSCNFYL